MGYPVKMILKFLCVLMTALLLLVGCEQTEQLSADTDGPEQTDVSSTDDTSAPPETEDTTKAADTEEPIVDDFDPAADPRYGTAVNVDCDEIIRMTRSMGTDFSNLEEKCINWFASRYKDKHISDLIYNIDQVVPTESRDEWFDFYLEAIKAGTEMAATTEEFGRVTNEIYNELQMNPYEIWIEQCYENGINPWLSFRMNDTHAPNLGYACQDFFYTAEENGWCIGLEAGWGEWNRWCYDYSVPEVRAYYSEYIDEVLGKFDVYGIELDFQRNMHCFKMNSVDNCQYMDLFMEEVNRIVAKYEEQYGHEIKIMARIARDIDQNMYFGFDVRNWAENDWIDVIVAASYFGQTDSRMPIAAWKEALQDYEKVEVYAGLEQHTISTTYSQNAVTLAGYTSMYLQQGADKIYLFNLFGGNEAFYRICSSLDAALSGAKRVYLVVGQDMVPVNSGIELDDPFPMQIRGGQEGTVVIEHGRLNADRDTYIYVGISKMAFNEEKLASSNLKVTYNGVECEYKGETTKAYVKTAAEFGYMFSFKVPDSACRMAESGEIVISTDNTMRVLYLELMNGPPNLG